MLGKYAHLARLEPFGPHVLRHCFATNYLAKQEKEGVNRDRALRDLAYLMGHNDINTVMIYTSPSLDDLGQRME